MTKEDWIKVQDVWSSNSAIVLQIDGFKITLHLESFKMELYRCVYVNNLFKGKWICNYKSEYPTEGIRFYQTKNTQIYSAKEVKEHHEIFGLKAANEMKNKRFECKLPYWSSFRSFKKHIIENNNKIELIEC